MESIWKMVELNRERDCRRNVSLFIIYLGQCDAGCGRWLYAICIPFFGCRIRYDLFTTFDFRCAIVHVGG